MIVVCWNCQADTKSEPICPSCGKVQPLAPGATHFDVFGLKRSYAVDVPALEKQYRELSLKLHPDRFAKADAKERRMSLEQTSALNDAYKTLRDPVRRAFYLLKLHGLDLDREDGSTSLTTGAGGKQNMPMEFLEEVMELREELDQAKKKKDVAKAQTMADAVEKKRKVALETAVGALQKLEQNASDKASLQTASFELARVRYFQRFLEEVAAIEEEQL